MKRTATAVWKGSIKEGSGHLTTQSNILHQTPYSFVSRFENGTGTNPEELMAAAHAGCFTMKLSLDLTTAGFTPSTLTTTAAIHLENGVITQSQLFLEANIPGITNDQFQVIAAGAKENCPVSKAYNMQITLQVTVF